MRAEQDLTTGRECLVWGRGARPPEFSKASIDGVCIINNLAKHDMARRALVDAGFLKGLMTLVTGRDPVVFTLSGLERGEVEVVFVASAMAAARLCAPEQLEELFVAPSEINAIVVSLQHALAQEPWMGILWGVGECLAPLAALSECPANRLALAGSGLIRLLLDIFTSWQRKHVTEGVLTRSKARLMEPMGAVAQHVAASAAAASAAGVVGWEAWNHWNGITGSIDLDEVALALVILCRMCEVESVFDAVAGARAHATLGATSAVIRDAKLREQRRGLQVVWLMCDRSDVLHWGLWPLHDRLVALYMGMHGRLGQSSLIRRLDPGVWEMIIRESCCSVQVVCEALQQRLEAKQPPGLRSRQRTAEIVGYRHEVEKIDLREAALHAGAKDP